ncbi:TetR/AcrR family transcriptional regulator C-terminal domain-containing protein [Roseococcus sp.]|uniref:TetR/AcrR family transcriptional regulator C-terminal domain-containing protein n=1 Tax=Roseococcus sp. TaxID=2109646 RepID=UPI003BAB7A79
MSRQGAFGWKTSPMAAGMLFGLTIGEPHMWMLLGQRSALDQAEIAHRVAIAVDIFLDGALIRES